MASEKTPGIRKKIRLAAAAIVILTFVVAGLFTWQMSFVRVAYSEASEFCAVEISGVPLPVRYRAVQYDFYDEATQGTIFAECIWPHFGRTLTIKWDNALANWLLYSALFLSVVWLFRGKFNKSN